MISKLYFLASIGAILTAGAFACYAVLDVVCICITFSIGLFIMSISGDDLGE